MTEQERWEKVYSRLSEHYNRVQQLGYEVVAIMVQGSQNYNMDTYTDTYMSDIDSRCIVLPKFDDFCKKEKPTSFTYELENKEHIDIKDIEVWLQLWKKGNVQFLECLFTDFFIVNTKYANHFTKIKNLANKVVDGHRASLYNAIYGMATQKLEALTHPYPTIKDKIDKYGADYKQAHHIIRLHDFILNLTNNKTFKQSLVPPKQIRDYLMDIKTYKKLMDVQELKILCKKYLADILDIKNKYLEKAGADNPNPKVDKQLEDIRIEMIKQFFRECLIKG